MQRRLLVFVTLAGAVAGIVVLLLLLSLERPPSGEVVVEPPREVAAPPPEPGLRAEKQHGRLAGKVVNGNTDEPIEAAKVIALVPYLEAAREGEVPFWGKLLEKKHVFTGKDGTFAIEELPPDYWNLWVEKRGYAWTTVPRAKFDATQVVKLYPACSLHGKVVYDDDSPATGIRILYTPQGTHSEVFEQYRRELYDIRTRPDGTFEYTDLPPGKFTVEVYPEDHLPAPWRYEPPLKPGENRDLGVRKLDRGFGMLVRVLWRGTNEPVEGIEVVVRPVGDPEPRTKTGRRRLTDAKGLARISGLGGQVLETPKFMVAANVPGLGPVVPDEPRLFGPDEEVTIYLRKAGVVRGKVLRPGGDPLEMFWVDLEPKGFATHQLRVRGEKGAFEIHNVPEGRYVVHVRYGNLVDQDVDAEVAGGQVTDVGTVTLLAGGEIWGTVRNSDGSEIGIVKVHLAREVWNERLGRSEFQAVKRAYCRKDGGYRILGVQPGKYWLWPEPEPASLTTPKVEVEMPAGVGAVSRDLVVYGTGHLDLVFVDQVQGSERRVVAVPTFLVPAEGGEETRWYANGTPLRGGRYAVFVEVPDAEGVSHRYKALDVEIQEGRTAGPIEVRLHEIRR